LAIDYHKNKVPDQVFINILAAGEKHPLSKKLTVDGLLILPVQRVPRYVLLLSDMLKLTSPTHPDFADLTKTMEKIKILAGEIDLAIGIAKSRAKCLEIQTRIELAFGKKSFDVVTRSSTQNFSKRRYLEKTVA